MERRRQLQIVLSLASVFLFLLLFLAMHFYFRRRRRGSCDSPGNEGFEDKEAQAEELLVFSGGEHLMAQDILDAPGEVVGKSAYGTLYRATIRTPTDESGPAVSAMLLRFVRSACTCRTEDILASVRSIGCVRHPNLVPLTALYVGPSGEKLFVHPFYSTGTLAQFLKGGSSETKRWKIIYELSLGIAKGLGHLHHGLEKPIIHGNLKSKNILLGVNLQPRLSNFGLHLLLSPTIAQEMLETSAKQGYKAPELIKMKDVSKEHDVYSFGIVFLEIVTCKDAPSCRSLAFDGKLSEAFGSGLTNSRANDNCNHEVLLRCYELALSCCSQFPALRPDIKDVIRRLEEMEVR